MGYAGRHNIYDGAIRKMVTLALEAREEEFRKEHSDDTNGQLIAYLRQCTAELQHTPWPGEILGGTVIAERFGSWEKALCAAGLPMPTGENKPSTFLRVQREEQRQKENPPGRKDNYVQKKCVFPSAHNFLNRCQIAFRTAPSRLPACRERAAKRKNSNCE